MKTMRWQDVATLVLGLLVAASPWLFGEATPAAPVLAAIVAPAAAIVALAAIDLDQPGNWEAWGLLLLGGWTIVAPYVVGVAAGSTLASTVTAAGFVVAALAGLTLYSARKDTEREHAHGH